MSENFRTVIGFPDCLKDVHLLHISSDDLNNSIFVIHNFIFNLTHSSSSMKRCKLFCLFLNQSYNSYYHVQKNVLSNDLQQNIEEGLFSYFDFLNEFDTYVNEIYKFNFEKFKNSFFDQLNDYFNSKLENQYLILDDISILLSLGVDIKNLFLFIRSLRIFCFNKNILLILQTYFDSDFSEEDDLFKLHHYLKSSTNLFLSINKLKTGYSKNHDGSLSIHDFHRNLHQTVLFKCHYKILEFFYFKDNIFS